MHVYKYTYSCNSCTSPWKPFFSFSNYIASSNKTFNCIIPKKQTSDIQNTYCTNLLQYIYCRYFVAFHFSSQWHTIWQLCFGDLVRKAKDCIACSQKDSISWHSGGISNERSYDCVCCQISAVISCVYM